MSHSHTYDPFYDTWLNPSSSSMSSDEAFARAFDLPSPSITEKPTTSSIRQMTDELAEFRMARSFKNVRQQEKKKIQEVIRDRAAQNSAPAKEEQKHHRVVQEEEEEEEDEDMRLAMAESLRMASSSPAVAASPSSSSSGSGKDDAQPSSSASAMQEIEVEEEVDEELPESLHRFLIPFGESTVWHLYQVINNAEFVSEVLRTGNYQSFEGVPVPPKRKVKVMRKKLVEVTSSSSASLSASTSSPSTSASSSVRMAQSSSSSSSSHYANNTVSKINEQVSALYHHIKTEIVAEQYRSNTEKLDEYIATIERGLHKLNTYDPPLALLYRSWDFHISAMNDCHQKIMLDIYVVSVHHLYRSTLTYERAGSMCPWHCVATDLLQSCIYAFAQPLSGYPLAIFQAIATSQNGHTRLPINHQSSDGNEQTTRRDREQLNKLLIGICQTLPGYTMAPLPRGWKEMYMEHLGEYIYINEKTLEHTPIRPVEAPPVEPAPDCTCKQARMMMGLGGFKCRLHC